MKTLWIAIVFTAVSVAACAGFERAETATKAKQSMIGMSKEQVLTCMGPPARQESSEAIEAWAYPSGGDATYGKISGDKIRMFTDKQCIVNILFENDRVSAVNYLGQTSSAGTVTGTFSEYDQCGYAVQQCVQ